MTLPALHWYAGEVGKSLAHNTTPTSPTSWKLLSKDGSHTVLGESTHKDVFTKEETCTGHYVIDRKKLTVQVVTDIPPEYQEGGTNF